MEPKYKVGDTVWMTSNWFSGSYIPDCFVVAAVRCVDGKYQYRKKRMRTWWDEDKLFPTEEECQIHEIKRFIQNTQKYAQMLVNNCRALGVEQQAVKLLTAPKNELPTPNETAKKPLYEVGQHVWGHQHKGMSLDDYANPHEYIVVERQRNINEGEVWYSYFMRGHGTFVFDEDFLYPTKEAAILDNARLMRENTEAVLKGLKERCKALGLPTEDLRILENNK